MSKDTVENSKRLKSEGPTVEAKKYEITFDLPEKYWYDELKRYLFKPWEDEPLIIQTVPEIKIETTDIWRIPGMLNSGDIKHIEIRRIV
jgi:hypothetical protein